MLCPMRFADPHRCFCPAAREYRPGLWLVSAPLLSACELAATVSPESLILADGFNWVASRRIAFLAGRAVAAVALAAMGRAVMVARAPDGAPCWPAGCVGSIAHDAHWAVALVADSLQWAAVGVDVEPDAPLPADAAHIVLLPQDRANLIRTFGTQSEAHSRLIFSAKECVHKALHPWRGAWLEFDEVAIECHSENSHSGRWQATPVSTGAQQAFAQRTLNGEWWREDGALWTLLALRR